ncbi:hypothetical protein ACHAXA_008189 [Cyclostephanos tholiformis]|uniref:Phytanoyl-CoA dioxygenase n=1 Tax=Cyclostephanos tholiformis TaxID=382380 RepID=A0ABD3SCC2_9STRA
MDESTDSFPPSRDRENDNDNDDDDGGGRTYRSWVRGDIPHLSPHPRSWRPTDRCRAFDEFGYVRIPKFASTSEVMSMRIEMERMVEDEWRPSLLSSSSMEGDGEVDDDGMGGGTGGDGGGRGVGVTVFRTDSGQVNAQGRSDYFLDSASAVHYFAEVDAVDPNTGYLRDEYVIPGGKLRALNKAGHGLHLRRGPFQEYSTSSKVVSLLIELGYVDPILPQSMYIFKQATKAGGRGGEVTSHQDSTFLYTEPRQTCVGLWLALDDATIENGCLWVRPGSHTEGLRRRFVRNPRHFGNSPSYVGDDNDDDAGGGDRSEPQIVFRNLIDDDEYGGVTWEGGLPENSLPMPECTGLHDAGFVPLTCEAGDLLVFAGTLDHLSLPNYSTGARHTFQLHCVEGERAGITWSRENWLQYPPGVSFVRLVG